MGNPFLKFGILILLLIRNGVFSGKELAVVGVRRSRLEVDAERGSSAARITLRLASNPGGFLATVRVGITLIDPVIAVLTAMIAPSVRVSACGSPVVCRR